MLAHISRRAAAGALGLLLTVAAVWLWAHEGHQALPTKGARLDPNNPNVLLVTAEARAALGVETGEVIEREVEARLVAPAVVVAPWQNFAYATARLSGRVVAVHAQAGQSVKQGQVLGEVQSLELENLQLALLEAQNDVRLTDGTLRDLKAASGAISGQVIAEAEAKYQEAQNTLDLARHKLLGLGISAPRVAALLQARESRTLRTLPVTSPRAGVIGRVHVQVGAVIESAHHLFEIVDSSTVWVKIGILEHDLARVDAGMSAEVRLTAYPADVFRGEVQGVGVGLDPQSHQGTVWVDLSNSAAGVRPVLPGMFGQAAIVLPARSKRLTVPADAVIRDGVEHSVLVETGPGQYLRQFIAPGRQSEGVVEIVAGQLVPGDRVVTTGTQQLAAFFGMGVLRPSAEAVQHLGLETEPARLVALASTVRLGGEIEYPPDHRALAAARLAGTVHRLHVGRDQRVQAGDIIAEVASLEWQDLQLDLLRTHLQLELLEQTLERLRPLAERKAVPTITRRQWREAQAAHTAALLRRDSLRLKLEAVGLTSEQLHALTARRQIVDAIPVRAPISGVVAHLRAALGQAVKAEDPLVEIHDPDGALVRGFVAERQLARVRVGQRARVRLTAEPGWVGEGEVVRSSEEFQSADRTLAVWVRLKQSPPHPPRHGLLAELTLIADESLPVLSVPRAAVLREGTTESVFVRHTNGSFERRRVRIGRGDDLRLEITDGLRGGEEVAVRGVAELQTGYAALK